jgi:hypothetical protein
VGATAAATILAGLAGCGGGDESTAQPQVTPTATTAPEPTTPPVGTDKADEGGVAEAPYATFRRNLTYALTEHVYLVGLAAQTAVAKSETSQVVKDALDALEDNTGALVAVFGPLLEDAEREEFRTGWMAFTRAFYDYAVAIKDEDSAERGKATAAMEEYRVAAAAFFTEVTDGNLPQYLTKAELKDHIFGMKKAVDAVAAEDPGSFDLLRQTAERVGETATKVTKAFFADAEDIGDLEEQAPTVRAQLAGYAVQHTYLTGMSVVTAYTDPKRFSGAPYAKAKVAIDDNAKAMGEVVREVATSTQQANFLEEWRRAIRDLEDYAEGAYFDSQRVREGALEYLDGDRKTTGRFFDRLTKGRDAELFADELGRHIATFAGTVDALRTAFARSRS